MFTQHADAQQNNQDIGICSMNQQVSFRLRSVEGSQEVRFLMNFLITYWTTNCIGEAINAYGILHYGKQKVSSFKGSLCIPIVPILITD